jgi:hypothetical protein
MERRDGEGCVLRGMFGGKTDERNTGEGEVAARGAIGFKGGSECR